MRKRFEAADHRGEGLFEGVSAPQADKCYRAISSKELAPSGHISHLPLGTRLGCGAISQDLQHHSTKQMTGESLCLLHIPYSKDSGLGLSVYARYNFLPSAHHVVCKCCCCSATCRIKFADPSVPQGTTNRTINTFQKLPNCHYCTLLNT